jgi:hypothetical protein
MSLLSRGYTYVAALDIVDPCPAFAGDVFPREDPADIVRAPRATFFRRWLNSRFGIRTVRRSDAGRAISFFVMVYWRTGQSMGASLWPKKLIHQK